MFKSAKKVSLIAFTLLLTINLINCSTDNTVDSFDYDETDPTDTLQAGDLIWSDEFSNNGAPDSDS